MTMMGIDVDAVGNHSFDRGPGLLPDAADPAGRLPVAQRERRRPRRQDADGVDSRRTCSTFPARRQGRVRRLHDRVDARASSSRATSTRSRSRPGRSRGQRRGGERSTRRSTRSSPSATRVRPAGRSPTRPVRSIDIADGVENVDVVIGDHNDLQVDRDAPERRARDREPRQGHPLHPDPDRASGPARRASSTRRPTSTSRGTSASRPTRRSRRRSTS